MVGDGLRRITIPAANRGECLEKAQSEVMTNTRAIARLNHEVAPSVAGVRHTFWSIQYLRGLAAIAVVVFHATTGTLAPPGAYGFKLGEHGVDIFFVISGFIMFTAARNESVVRFLIVRAIRIYPLYWAALLTLVLITHFTAAYGISGRELLASILLWPRYSFGHPDKIWPILVPGWTLTYELFFYAIFSIGILTRRVVAVPIAILTVLIVVGRLTHPHAAPLVVATSPLLAEFVIGMMLGVLIHRRMLNYSVLAIVWGLAVAVFWSTGLSKPMIMANAGAIVAAALLAEPYIVRAQSRLLKLLGDASYAIYLVHVLVLGIPETFFADVLAQQDVTMRWGIVVMMILLATWAGIIVHIVIERPLLKRLRPLADAVAARFPRGANDGPRDVDASRAAAPLSITGVVVYFCYGREDIFEQTLYSILSLLHICERDRRACRIAVYTDAPDRFASLPVETIMLSPTQLDTWLGNADYIHRRKTCVILDALARFETKVAFIDSDTWFSAHPERIFARVGPGLAAFHICEGFVASTGTPFDTALARQLELVPLRLRPNVPVEFGPRTRMWNTGVIGVDPADRPLMLDALALSDAIWRTADPAGAYGKKIHHAEQFATGYAFRHCRLSETADCVYHYWPADAKRVFAAALPGLVAQGLADPRGAVLAACYAGRYRERGTRAAIDAAKMTVRRVGLALGLPVKGARRSVW